MSGPPLPLEDERLPTTSYHDYWDQPIPGTDKFQKWKKVRVLGRGSYGTLRLVKGEDGTIRAVKEISRFTTPTAIKCQELHALIKLKPYPDHFVQFYGWWEDHESIYFAMEYIEQGDLMALLVRQRLSEDDGRDIAKQLVEGLDVMHRNHLCHRDLKPENILVVSSSPGSLRVKLADFGCAKLAVDTHLHTALGTDGYMAPEVLGYFDTDTSIYTFKADLWSLGCVLFYALTMKLPLRGYTSYSGYTTGVLPFPRQDLVDNNISSLGIKFIIELMTPEPEKRLGASQALVHTWFVGGGSRSEELDEEDLTCSSPQTGEHFVWRTPATIAYAATDDPANEQVRERPATTVEECISFFVDYFATEKRSLRTFYKDEDIPKLGWKAKTMFDALIELGCKKETAQQLTLLVLYDIVMLIDDSRSMKTEERGERIETLHRTIDEITRIYDYANENGIKSVKFLNDKRGIVNVKNRNWKRNFDKRVYNGVTKIGTSLSQKVLDKFVWGERMTKPLLVMIITDGDVEGERKGLLEDVIANCLARLARDEQRGDQAVSFHFSRVGNDREAQRLLEQLNDSPTFGDHVDYLPAGVALEKLRDPEGDHRWTVLPKLLLGAISPYWNEGDDDVMVDFTAYLKDASKEDDSDVDADLWGYDDDEDYSDVE